MATDYGSDCRSIISDDGTLDLDPYFTVVTGVDAVAWAVIRRFVTRRGTLRWDPAAGYDIRALLNEAHSTRDPGALHAARIAIEAEAEKDERVESAQAKLVFNPGTSKLTITLTCTTVENESFTLVLAVPDLTVEILRAA